MLIFCKIIADIVKAVLALKGVFSEHAYACILTY